MEILRKNKVRRENIFNQTQGFTLIELLTVISIISLLIAIILPALSRARENSRRIICASGMRQISVAFRNYSVDNNDQIYMAQKVMEFQNPWIWAMLPYIDGDNNKRLTHDEPADLWFCPSDKNPYPSAYSPHGQEYTSYLLNGYHQKSRPRSGWNQASPEIRLGPAGGYRFSQIRQPSECMLITETSYYGQIYDAENPNVAHLRLDRAGHHRNTTGFYHNGYVNILYVDGRVDNIRGRTAEVVQTPVNVKSKGHQFWNDLTLPDSTQNPSLWGPGYR